MPFVHGALNAQRGKVSCRLALKEFSLSVQQLLECSWKLPIGERGGAVMAKPLWPNVDRIQYWKDRLDRQTHGTDGRISMTRDRLAALAPIF